MKLDAQRPTSVLLRRGSTDVPPSSGEPSASHEPLGPDADRTSADVSMPAVLLLGSLLFGLIRQGGFYEGQFTILAGLMMVTALALVVRHAKASLPGLLFVAACGAAITASALTSGGWNTAASGWLAGAVMVATGWTIGSLARDQTRTMLVTGLQLLALITAATATWGVVFRSVPWARFVATIWRGEATLTYANAAAALILMGLVITVARAEASGHLFQALAGVGLTTGLVATGTRTAWLLAAIVVIADIASRPSDARRRGLHAWVTVVAGAAPPSVGVLIRSDEGAALSPVVVGVALLVGVALASVLWFKPWERFVIAGVVVAGVVAATAPPSRQALAPIVADRLDPASIFTRLDEWNAAIGVWQTRPLIGVGPGRDVLAFEHDGVRFIALFAHNEYLQVMAELGLIGMVVLAAGLIGVARLWNQHRSSADGLQRACAIAAAAFLAHSAMDFLWHLPVLAIIAAVLAGIGTAQDPAC